MSKLKKEFYLRQDVVMIARELLGKLLVTKFNGHITSGIITETEAYNGVVDKASHAYGNRRTNRTEVMYQSGGVAYVYLCYGIHSLFNVVTNQMDIPHAVLIRSVKPVDGIKWMQQRRDGRKISEYVEGPGNVSKVLGIHYSHTGLSLCGNCIWIEDATNVEEKDLIITPRIGVDYAGEDALLPYRFVFSQKNEKG